MKIGHSFTALIGVFLFTLVAQAQGIIIPRPCPRPEVRCPPPMEIPQRPLKVKSIRFTAKITDQVAVTQVEQVFENDTPYCSKAFTSFRCPTMCRSPSSQCGTATSDWSVKFDRAMRRDGFTTTSFGRGAIPRCSNTPARIFFKPVSFRFNRTAIRRSS